jgi:hypothetical protein
VEQDGVAVATAQAALQAQAPASSVNLTPPLLVFQLGKRSRASEDNGAAGPGFLLLQPYHEHTLADLCRFSPGVLDGSMAKPLFLAYQLVLALRRLHSQGVHHGR